MTAHESPRTLGYARAPRPQLAHERARELEAAGATRTFVEKEVNVIAGTGPTWCECLAELRRGDALIVRALSDVAPTMAAVVHALHKLGTQGVSVRSLTEPALRIDVESAAGADTLRVLGALADFRRQSLQSSIRAGLDQARAEGRTGGRPTVMTPERAADARRLRVEGRSVAHIAQTLAVSASSVRRALRNQKPAPMSPEHDLLAPKGDAA